MRVMWLSPKWLIAIDTSCMIAMGGGDDDDDDDGDDDVDMMIAVSYTHLTLPTIYSV